MTQECICCHKQKDLKLFRERNKTCKLCQWFKKHKLEILYLWEDDILHNIEKCKQLINEYIAKNGILENYNSYNYQFISGDLILKENIINPYFI